uniref:Uncharacterized protein n=1 Tax=Arcella intermedia TaxID=1963864 RepID=A0A6B2LKK9_9EUKA
MVKCVLVGDWGVGKTCMVISYQHPFPQDYIPTIVENTEFQLPLNGTNFTLSLWDTAAAEEYDRLRPLVYHNTSIFLVVFSVASPLSLQNVKSRWWGEVSHYCPGVPVLLVGNKVDLREDGDVVRGLASKGLAPTTFEEGVKVAKEIKAIKYLETSALTKIGLSEVFEEAVRHIAFPAPPKKLQGGCLFL